MLEARTLLSTITWVGAGDGANWSDRLNWAGGNLPGAGDDVVINLGSKPTITFNTGASGRRTGFAT